MSPASTESNGLMRERSCSSQGLVLQKVSLVCTACGLFLCSDCSVLQACCRQRLSLPSMGSIWSLARVWWVLTGCALVCLWNETCYHLYQNRGPAKLSGQEGWHGLCAVLLRGRGQPSWDWGSCDWEGQFYQSAGGCAWCKQVRQPVLVLCAAFLHVALCLCWGVGGGKWHQTGLLF